jgi:hypothetical protein
MRLARDVSALARGVNAAERPKRYFGLLSETNLGSEVLRRLRELLGVETTGPEAGLEWARWGAVQRARSRSAAGPDGWPCWSVELRTRALEGFGATPAQLSALSVELPLATVAGVVRGDQPGSLELASRLDMRAPDSGWVLRVLTIAARAQAAEARHLSRSRVLASVGLTPAVDLQAEAPAALALAPEEAPLGRTAPEVVGSRWTKPELLELVEVLKAETPARVVPTPSGMAATFPVGGAQEARSILEVTAGAEHSLLGKGLSFVLRTPVRRGLMEAMALNECEVGQGSGCDAVGGWVAAESGLVHSSFYCDPLHQKGVVLPLLRAYARRAQEAARLAARWG